MVFVRSMFLSDGALGGMPSGQVVAPVPLDDSCPPDSGVDVYAKQVCDHWSGKIFGERSQRATATDTGEDPGPVEVKS